VIDMTEPIVLWYKKTLKKTGKPIIVQQGKGKNLKEFQVASFKLNKCRIEMSFNNSVGKPKAAGASTVLYVYPLNGETIEELCK
jgi:hypothetical protein